MNTKIWILNPQPSESISRATDDLVGTYAATANGSDCVLKLWATGDGYVHGSFIAEGERLEVRAGFSPKTGRLQGHLLDPLGQMPVAVFDTEPSREGLKLRFLMPDLEEILDWGEPEELQFGKVTAIEI